MPEGKILVIHGNDLEASRKLLNQEKSQFLGEKIILPGEKLSFAELFSALPALSLLNEKRLLVIENFFSVALSSEKKKILQALPKNFSHRLIFWEGEEIEKKLLLQYLPQAKIILCNFPPLLFKFLESLGEKPPGILLETFHRLLREKEAETIFAMMIRQFRLLLIAKDLGEKGLFSLAPWQRKKFLSQARFFSWERLVFLYRQLFAIDIKIKTSQTPYSLTELLDIFLANL